MAKIHLYGIEVKDVAKGNKYLGGMLFKKTNDNPLTFENFADLTGSNVRVPVSIQHNGQLFPTATYPDGSQGFVDINKFIEFDFDDESTSY